MAAREIKIKGEINRNSVAEAIFFCCRSSDASAVLINEAFAAEMMKFARGAPEKAPDRFTDMGLLFLVVPECIVADNTMVFVSTHLGT